MFLEFGQAPKVNGTNIDDPTNEFSVFAPTPEAANAQVCWSTNQSMECMQSWVASQCCFSLLFAALLSDVFGSVGGDLCPVDALYQAHLPSSEAQACCQEVKGRRLLGGHCHFFPLA